MGIIKAIRARHRRRQARKELDWLFEYASVRTIQKVGRAIYRRARVSNDQKGMEYGRNLVDNAEKIVLERVFNHY